MLSTTTTSSNLSLARAYLEIVEGPGLGRKIPLREGQVRYVGRAREADDCCPDNPTMSSIHFSVRWSAGHCELKDLQSANGTWRHGKKITEALLSGGDEIKAGKATFRLIVDDGGASFASVGSVSLPKIRDTDVEDKQDKHNHDKHNHDKQTHDKHIPDKQIQGTPALGTVVVPGAVLTTGLAIERAANLPPETQLGEEAQAMLADDLPLPQFIDLLSSREHYLDALRAVAHSLAKRSAVQWACQCVRSACGDDLNKADQAALKTAEAWAADPSEENRRTAEAAATAAEHKSAASWAAMAAFFSTGSLSPPAAPLVPPPPHLASHAAAGAAMLAAVAHQPEKAPQRYEEFLQLAKEHMK